MRLQMWLLLFALTLGIFQPSFPDRCTMTASHGSLMPQLTFPNNNVFLLQTRAPNDYSFSRVFRKLYQHTDTITAFCFVLKWFCSVSTARLIIKRCTKRSFTHMHASTYTHINVERLLPNFVRTALHVSRWSFFQARIMNEQIWDILSSLHCAILVSLRHVLVGFSLTDIHTAPSDRAAAHWPSRVLLDLSLLSCDGMLQCTINYSITDLIIILTARLLWYSHSSLNLSLRR